MLKKKKKTKKKIRRNLVFLSSLKLFFGWQFNCKFNQRNCDRKCFEIILLWMQNDRACEIRAIFLFDGDIFHAIFAYAWAFVAKTYCARTQWLWLSTAITHLYIDFCSVVSCFFCVTDDGTLYFHSPHHTERHGVGHIRLCVTQKHDFCLFVVEMKIVIICSALAPCKLLIGRVSRASECLLLLLAKFVSLRKSVIFSNMLKFLNWIIAFRLVNHYRISRSLPIVQSNTIDIKRNIEIETANIDLMITNSTSHRCCCNAKLSPYVS